MRKIAMMLFVLSSAAYANCPNLSGTYTRCEPFKMVAEEQVTISQSRSGGAEVYSIDYQGDEPMTLQLIADGRTRSQTYDQDGIVVTVSETTSCKDNQLSYKNTTEMLGTEISFGMKFYRQNDGGLVTDVITPDGTERAVCY